MTTAAGRIKELINDLLSYSQLQQQELQFEPVDLNLPQRPYISLKEKMAIIETENLPAIHGKQDQAKTALG